MKIEERVELLERRNRRLTIAMVAMLGLAMLGGLVGRLPLAIAEEAGGKVNVVDEVRARSFVLVDQKGEIRASLTMVSDMPQLLLSAMHGESSVIPGVLTLRGKNDTILTALSTDGLRLLDDNGVSRAELLTESGLSLNDEKGKTSAWLSENWLGFPGEKGEPGTVLQDSGLFLNDVKGKLRATMNLLDSEPGLFMFDPKGETIWSAPR